MIAWQPDNAIARQEVFGPVLKVLSFDDDEAVSIANSADYGLVAGTFTRDPQGQLVGGLAAILKLAVSSQQKTTIQLDSGFGRVLMIIGAGFVQASTIKIWV